MVSTLVEFGVVASTTETSLVAPLMPPPLISTAETSLVVETCFNGAFPEAGQPGLQWISKRLKIKKILTWFNNTLGKNFLVRRVLGKSNYWMELGHIKNEGLYA
jgi:hypothetical protein